MLAHGKGADLELTDDSVIIRRRGVLSAMTVGFQGEKKIRIREITAVQLSDAGIFMNGYIHFSFRGGREKIGGIMDAASDENSVIFTKSNAAEIHAFKDAVEARMDAIRAGGGSSVSAADEIEKFAKLRDNGIISEDEFQAKKAKLLGL